MANLNKKPTKIKQLQGTFREDRATPNELEFTTLKSLPEPPDTLTERGKVEWGKRVIELDSIGMLSDVYLPSLELYCIGIQLMAEGTKKMNAIKKTDEKSIRLRRYWNMQLNDGYKIVTTLASKFGFTPSDKAKVSMPENTENSEFFD